MSRILKILCLVLVLVTTSVPMQMIQDDSIMAYSSQPLAAANDIQKRLVGAIALYVGSTQALVNNQEIQIDNTSAEVKPIIRNDRTLVPVRFIAESMGAKVNWEAGTSTATVTLNGKSIKLVIGKTKMDIDGTSVDIDTPAEIIGNRVFIPLRNLSEALNKKVFYDRGLIIISNEENIFNKTSEKSAIDQVISNVNNLPVVGSYENMKSLVSKFNSGTRSIGGIQWDMANAVDMKTTATLESVPQAAKSETSNQESTIVNQGDYSKTNVQVEGVDEADVVKTDGQYIYQVNKQRIIIAQAYPVDGMKVVSTLTFSNDGTVPSEIYVDDKYLVVIGSVNKDVPVTLPKIDDGVQYCPPSYTSQTVKALMYDISDKSNIKKLREFEIDGNYVSSRKIGSALYLISNKYAGYTYRVNEKDPQIMTPCYRDTAVKDGFISVAYPEIRYFPQVFEPNYMIIGSINLDKMSEAAKVNTYLGAGQNVYASQQNLYVSATNYNYTTMERMTSIKVDGSTTSAVKPSILPIAPQTNTNTTLYKFSLNNGQITYINKGEVPGTILNQFSMDENNSYFRITTTVGEVWNNTSKNNIYILDELLNIVGKIEGIAPGEKIYSTRFMGDRAYVVTFKKVDPLFVIDLQDPKAPKIVGALKIPGYSDYLHPYDENHIIGFGKDAVEIGSGAYYQGMKIAIFDVTDVTKPVEMFKENIGDRGTDSELLRNHKALLFSKEKDLLAFPVTVMEKKNDGTIYDKKDTFEYGQFTFQGAYVYNIDLTKGFSLKGKITHLTNQDYLKAGNYQGDSDNYIQRILYIKDTLYTLSNSKIKANNLTDLQEKNTLIIP